MRIMTQFRSVPPAIRMAQLSLYTLPLLDEAVSAVPVLAMPLLHSEMALDYSQVGWLFSIVGVTAWLVEPGINAMSDYWPKRRIILLSILGMVIALGLAGSSPTYPMLLLAFALMGVSNGPALGMAQAFLIDSNLGESLRTMTRWTLMGALGDLAGPALIATALAIGMGWRGLFWAGALIWLAAFCAFAIQRLPMTKGEAANEEEPFRWQLLRENLVQALRTPLLLRWLLLVLLPGFLDELFLAFAALFMQEELEMTPPAISMAVGVQITGGLIGLVLLERFGHRLLSQKLLGWLAVIVLAGLLLFVLSPSPLLAIIALWLTGIGASGWYPIAKAEAYRTLPGQSGMVRAIYSLVTPLEIVAPLLIGLVAEAWGIRAGVALLLLAPIAVLLLRPRQSSQKA